MSTTSDLSESYVISNITKALKELNSSIAKENQLLKEGKVSEVSVVIEEKMKLVQAFNDASNVVDDYARKGGVFNKDTDALIKLKNMFGELNKLNKENEILIRVNLEVSGKIVEIYKENKVRQTLKQFGYNKEGKVTIEDKIEKIMPSISINNKI